MQAQETKATIRKHAKNVFVVERDWPANSEQWVLLTSDWHWDNPLCRRDLLEQDLQEAVARNAMAFCFGDLFCAMQGKGDPRGNKSSIRPEHTSACYLDSLIDTATEWLEPYKNNIAAITDGNHETSVRNRLETDLLARLANRLGCLHGPYCGFIKFRHLFSGCNHRESHDLYFHHGNAAGGEVTAGVSGFQRIMAQVDADIYVMGHIHERYSLDRRKYRLNLKGTPVMREVKCVRCSTYKDEFALAEGSGWHHEKGRGGKPLGGHWLRFYRKSNREIRFEIRETGH